jgi:hypothetical protein
MRTNFLFALLVIGMVPVFVRAETSAHALARYETVRLGRETWQNDRLWMKIGHDIAARHGTALIPLILERSCKWENDEFLLFTPIILNLPLDDAITELARFAKGADERKALWAREYLIELETYLGESREKVSALLAETEKEK